MKTYAATTLHTAAAANATGPTVAVGSATAVTVHVVVAGTGTITFQGSVDGTNYIAVPMKNAAGTIVTTATAAGIFTLEQPTALQFFQAPLSSWSAGAFTVVLGRR